MTYRHLPRCKIQVVFKEFNMSAFESKKSEILAKYAEVADAQPAAESLPAVEVKETGTPADVETIVTEASGEADSDVADDKLDNSTDDKAKEVKPEAKHTYENRIKSVISEKEKFKAELEKEKARVKDLEEKLSLKPKNEYDFDYDGEGTSDKISMSKEDFNNLIKENLVKFSEAQKEAEDNKISNLRNEEVKKILSDKYSSRYDDTIGGFDDEATEELKMLGDLYKVNPELWLGRMKKSGIDSVISLIRGSNTNDIKKIVKKAEAATTIDNKATTKISKADSKSRTLREILNDSSKKIK